MLKKMQEQAKQAKQAKQANVQRKVADAGADGIMDSGR